MRFFPRADERGHSSAGVTVECCNGLSINRRGIHEVAAALENGKADIVLIKDVSRMARRSIQLLEFIRFLRSRNAPLECITGEDTTFLERLAHAP